MQIHVIPSPLNETVRVRKEARTLFEVPALVHFPSIIAQRQLAAESQYCPLIFYEQVLRRSIIMNPLLRQYYLGSSITRDLPWDSRVPRLCDMANPGP